MFLLTFASCSREEQPETTRAVLGHPALGTRTQKFPLASSVSHSLHVSALDEQHTRTLSCRGLWVRVPKELPLMFLLTFASCSREEQPETTRAVLGHPALGTRTQKFPLASSVSHSLHVSALDEQAHTDPLLPWALGTRTQRASPDVLAHVRFLLAGGAARDYPCCVQPSSFGYAYPKILAGLISVSLSACICFQ
jgi:hypothetical protein